MDFRTSSLLSRRLRSELGGRAAPPCCLHVLVHGAISGELGLAGRQLQVEVVDGERDDDDQPQNEAQDEGERLLQALPLVRDAFVGCNKSWGLVSDRNNLTAGAAGTKLG